MFCKRCSTKRSSRQGLLHRTLLTSCVLLFLIHAPDVDAAPDKVSEFQSQFDREPHATAKIKILEKLGAAQFAAATHAQKESNFVDIAFIFEKYRDNVRTAFELLKKQEPNSDKHSGGYRHLELQVRRGIREVEEILIIVPEEVRPPLQIVHEDLVHIDDELIRAIFPRHTNQPDSPTLKEAKP
ncbi:MAG TPA: hypothetical protein VII25_01325 [Candidatus Acidoferrum sp.]|jgi:hypothetical protein